MCRQEWLGGDIMVIKCIKRPVMSKEQVKECSNCGWISKSKSWCGKFGFYVNSLPGDIPQKPSYPPALKMAGNFLGAAGRHILSGLKNRTEDEQKKCREICEVCDNYVEESKLGPRCKICGCCTNIKTRWLTAHCPLDPPKW